MVEKVEVEITGKDSGGSAALRGVKTAYTELNSALELVKKGVGYVQAAYEATAGAALRYADQIRDLSAISGASAESTSRFVQVLDDFQLSAEDAEAATRFLTKNGLAPTVETLAQLSDEYVKLNTVEDRNNFLLEQFGRSGLQWVNLMNQGGEAIKNASGNAEDWLILSQQQLDRMEELRLKQDALGDSWSALMNMIGLGASGPLTDVVNVMLSDVTALTSFGGMIDEVREQVGGASGLNGKIAAGLRVTGEWAAGILNSSNAIGKNSDAIAKNKAALDAHALSLEEQKKKQEELEKVIKAANDARAKEFQSILSVQGAIDGFEQSNQDLIDKQNDLLNQMERLRAEGVEATAAEMVSLQREYDNTGEAITTLAKQHDEAMQKILFDMLMARLSVDGLTQAEFNLAIAAGQSLGILDEKAAKIADSFNQIVDMLANGAFNGMPSPELVQGIMNGESLNSFNVLTPYNMPTSADLLMHSRDAGGRGVPGQPVLIGRGAQPEMYVPDQAGTFYPNAGGGGNFTFVYSPQLSMGSRAEAEGIMAPIIEAVFRRMQRDGRAR